MKKVLGIFGLLVAICVATAIAEPRFFAAYNVQNQAMWIGLFGIISIGVAFVIITGGIDLSIGSVIGLVASLLPHALNHWHWSPAAAGRRDGACRRYWSVAWAAHHQDAVAAVRRDALRPAVLSWAGTLDDWR